ncbi:hypothetical protein AM493_19110 [Flavobacterium akiainvivens]|uniref:DUF4350 domain-containing protein n=1 Tax=Flavobacterium akiainvivens TaxID=1202724 RepID=A0A0N0RR33_9FLAO|nr:DUF4350 domain-containing protein [Flavobacterium akiainvivens]KOS07930.1 hypothetical protein AM493_19110 [Flavobacterium akiainvivens]SFQ29096.1 hypothetical protein SAMN05444144_102404 [Flavobacterium akiainvivens]
MKNKELIIVGSVVAFLAIVLTVVEALKPKPIDWTPTFSTRDKIPFGLYVLDAEANDLFKGDSVERFWMSPYEYFDPKYNYNTKSYNVKGAFLEISNADEIDEESVKELMYFADHGNTVMLSMKSFPRQLLDTLNIGMSYLNILRDSAKINLVTAPRDHYWIKDGLGTGYFSSLPGADSITVLGHQSIGLDDLPNFIEAKFGNGRFLLHTQPSIFTNYYLLKNDNYNYAQQVLSKIPRGTVYWKNQQANSKYFEDPGSKLRFIMTQPGLKWAWRLGLWGLLFFIIFNARRKQRVVPVIPPVHNTTIDFAKTIGNLYYQEGDHHNIGEKKIVYFLEHIRTEYLIDTSTLDDAFIEKLHLKTGKPEEDIRHAVEVIKTFRRNLENSEKDLVAINNAIEKLRL